MHYLWQIFLKFGWKSTFEWLFDCEFTVIYVLFFLLSSSAIQSWPEHPVLSRHSSLSSSYPANRQPPLHAMSVDYGHHSPPLHHPHIHPAPNAHSSPRSIQRSRMARYAHGRSPAQSFDEHDDLALGYVANCANTTSNLLGNGGMDLELLTSMDGQNQLQLPQMQPPLLPEKKRASDGDHSLGTSSPALSGFSSPHSGSSLSIPFPNVLPDLSAQTLGTASPLPGKLQSLYEANVLIGATWPANTAYYCTDHRRIIVFSRSTGQQAGYCKICAGHIQILVQARYLKGSR